MPLENNALTPNSIDIDYNAIPPGQKGDRPRRIPLNGSFHFTSLNPGELTIEFIGQSPLADGTRTLKPGKAFVAGKHGKFPFKCTLVRPDGHVAVLDPTSPGSPAGGELEVRGD